MTQKPIIYVSAATSVVGYGILKCLRTYYNNTVQLYGSTSHSDSFLPYFCDECFCSVPTTDSPEYLEWLSSFLLSHSISYAIPSIDPELVIWARNRKIFDAAQVVPLINSPPLIDLCSDKWLFYKRLASTMPSVAIPTSISNDYHEYPTPFLLKPRSGYGGRGIQVINSPSEYSHFSHLIGDLYVKQPIVSTADHEYSLSAFFGKQSELLDYICLRRKLAYAGYTESAILDSSDYSGILKDIAGSFLPVGPTNIQFRMEGAEIRLLEINPRISSATSIRSIYGYNEAAMLIEYARNGSRHMAKARKVNKDKRVYRFLEEVTL